MSKNAVILKHSCHVVSFHYIVPPGDAAGGAVELETSGATRRDVAASLNAPPSESRRPPNPPLRVGLYHSFMRPYTTAASEPYTQRYSEEHCHLW